MEQQLSGIERLRQQIEAGAGSASAFEQGLGLRLAEVASGRVLFKAETRSGHENMYGKVHGGWTAGVLDAAAGAAVLSVLEPGETYTTLSLQLNYLRALQLGTEVAIEAEIIRAGARVAISEARIVAAGEVAAFAVATCMRLRKS